MKLVGVSVVAVLIVFSPAGKSDNTCKDTAFSFDENIPTSDQFSFDDRDPDLPKPGDFKLINYYFMSNGCGEREVLVTVENTSPGTTTMTGDHIVAVSTSGQKRRGSINKRISGNTIESFTVSFGSSDLPFIKVIVEER